MPNFGFVFVISLLAMFGGSRIQAWKPLGEVIVVQVSESDVEWQDWIRVSVRLDVTSDERGYGAFGWEFKNLY